MERHRDDTPGQRPAGTLGGDLAAHVEAIVRAAEREAQAAQRAIEERRRSAEEEVQRYLAATRLHVDAETAARAARLETLGASARRLAAELSDAAAALTRELRRSDDEAAATLPRVPWSAPAPSADAPVAAAPPASTMPSAPTPPPVAPVSPVAPVAPVVPAPPEPEPTWSRVEPVVATAPVVEANGSGDTGAPDADVPSAARLVAIEMAVGGSSRAEVEQHLRGRLAIADPDALLDDVFGPASHAGSRLAWGEP